MKHIFFWKRLSQKQKLFFETAIIVGLTILIPVALSIHINSSKALAAWYDDNWAYRKRIDTTVASSSSDITNLQMLLTIDTSTGSNGISSGQMQGNCQDLRFTNINGKLLPYYIGSGCATTTTKVWVFVDLVPKNTTTMTLYMYYGNSSVASGSNAAQFDNVVNLKGYWTMNESSWNGTSGEVKDTSINGNNATAVNSTATITGKYGNAGNLVAANTNYLSGTDTGLPSGNGALTLEAWINPTGQADYRIMLMYGTNSTDQGVQFYSSSTYGLVFSFVGAACDIFPAGVSISNGVWQHVVVTKPSGSSTVKFYVNGVLKATASPSECTPNITLSTLNIGRHTAGGSHYDGAIDDLRIYASERTASQILDDYNKVYSIQTTASATIGPTTSIPSSANAEKATVPAAYYKFDEGTGTTVNSSTPNLQAGVLTGGTSQINWATEDSCISGKCLQFTGGTSGDVRIATISAAVQTMSFWARPASSSAALFDSASRSITASSGTLSATGFGGTTTTYVNGVQSTTIAANKWQYITVTTTNPFVTANTRIGSSKGDFLKGFMDEIRLYPFVRSAAQIQVDYNARSSNEGVSAALGASSKNLPGALSDGLVGYWKMDENSWTNDCLTATVLDSSGNGNNGASCPNATGPTGGAVGKFNKAGSFDGSDDYVTAGDTASLSITGTNITAEGWFKLNTNKNYNILIDKAYGLTTGYQIYTDASGTINWVTALNTLTTTATLSTGRWYHIAAVQNATTKYIYIDGVLSITNSSPQTLSDNTRSFFIGSGETASCPTNCLNGYADEVRIYNRALSPSEVSQLYNFAPGPVGYWKLDEKSGTSAFDSSGNGYTGTLKSGATFANTGKFEGAASFDGVSANTNRIEVGDQSAFKLTTVTLEGWIYRKGKCGTWNQCVLISKGTSGNVGYALSVQDDSGYKAILSIADHQSVKGTSILGTNQWFHIAASFDGTTVNMYVNGVLETSTAQTATPTFDTNPFRIGNANNANDLVVNGYLDDIKVYNYVRTQKQIIEDINVGHPSVGSPVGSAVGYWKFDEGYGTVTHSSGSKSIDANLVSSPTWTDAGKFNKALSFNGSSAYVAMSSDNSALKITSDISLSAWINLTNTSSSHDIICKYTGTASTSAYCLYTNSSGKLLMSVVDSTGPAIVTTTGSKTLSSSTWYHVVGVFKSASSVSLYINGVQDTQNTTSIPTILQDPTTVLDIGAENAGSNLFNGTIDEAKIYNYALTADEIKLDYNRGASLVLGALSDTNSLNTSQPQAAASEYCVPGDTASSSCAAPVGRWDFEEKSGTTTNDSSGGGTSCTLTNSPTWTTGKIGSTINLSRSATSYLTCGTSYNPANPVTFSAWIYMTSLANNNVIVAKDTAWAWYIRSSGGNQLSLFQNAGGEVWATYAFQTNTWYFVETTVDSSGNVKHYVNGQLVTNTSGTTVSLSSGANAFTIGKYSTDYFTGKVDNVRVFNYARSASQVAWDYNRGGPVGWWKMDECQGTIIHDSSGNGNNGAATIGGSGGQSSVGTCSTSSTAWGNGASGKFNSSFNFDGNDDYISMPDSPSLQLGSKASFSFWYYKNSASNYGTWISKNLGTGSLSSGWYQIMNHSFDDKMVFRVTQDGDTLTSVSAPSELTWHHIVSTYDGTTAKIYLDGVLDASTSVTATPTNDTTSLFMGRRSSGSGTDGRMDDVRIYNYTLTPLQIKLLYNQGASVRFGPSTGTP